MEEELTSVLRSALNRYQKYKKKHKEYDDSVLIPRFLQGLKQEYEIDDVTVPLVSKDPVEGVRVSYEAFFQLSKPLFKEAISSFNNELIGLTINLFSFIHYDTNQLVYKPSKAKNDQGEPKRRPLLQNDLFDNWLLSKEKVQQVVELLISRGLILKLKLKGERKYTFYAKPNYAFKKVDLKTFNEKFNKNLEALNSTSMITVNSNCLNLSIFNKSQREEKNNKGKKVLGLLMKIVMVMNSNNEVKLKGCTKETLYTKLSMKIKESQLDKVHLNMLLEKHFLLFKCETLIVNPVFARYKKKAFFKKVDSVDVALLEVLIQSEMDAYF